MISLHLNDLGESMQCHDEARTRMAAKQASFKHLELLLQEEICELRELTGSPGVDMQGICNSLQAASVILQELELQLDTTVSGRP